MHYLKNKKDSPIRHHWDYIQLIALENCSEFFIDIGLIGNNITPTINDSRRTFTKYFNALITLEHILDYLYYNSNYSQEGHKDYMKFGAYKNNILDQYPLLMKISNYANAYKHCQRKQKPHPVSDRDDIIFNDGLGFNLKLIKDAFKFWHDFINSKIEIEYKTNKNT